MAYPLKAWIRSPSQTGAGGAPPAPVQLISATVTNSCPIDLKIEPLTHPEHIYTNPMSFFDI